MQTVHGGCYTQCAARIQHAASRHTGLAWIPLEARDKVNLIAIGSQKQVVAAHRLESARLIGCLMGHLGEASSH